jgi:hypothetical protein
LKRFLLENLGNEKPLFLIQRIRGHKNGKREKVKDFNQCFITILTKFTAENAPLQSLAIEYYTSSLIPSIGMFVKWVGKDTLARILKKLKLLRKSYPLMISPIF